MSISIDQLYKSKSRGHFKHSEDMTNSKHILKKYVFLHCLLLLDGCQLSYREENTDFIKTLIRSTNVIKHNQHWTSKTNPEYLIHFIWGEGLTACQTFVNLNSKYKREEPSINKMNKSKVTESWNYSWWNLWKVSFRDEWESISER